MIDRLRCQIPRLVGDHHRRAVRVHRLGRTDQPTAPIGQVLDLQPATGGPHLEVRITFRPQPERTLHVDGRPDIPGDVQNLLGLAEQLRRLQPERSSTTGSDALALLTRLRQINLGMHEGAGVVVLEGPHDHQPLRLPQRQTRAFLDGSDRLQPVRTRRSRRHGQTSAGATTNRPSPWHRWRGRPTTALIGLVQGSSRLPPRGGHTLVLRRRPWGGSG